MKYITSFLLTFNLAFWVFFVLQIHIFLSNCTLKMPCARFWAQITMFGKVFMEYLTFIKPVQGVNLEHLCFQITTVCMRRTCCTACTTLQPSPSQASPRSPPPTCSSARAPPASQVTMATVLLTIILPWQLYCKQEYYHGNCIVSNKIAMVIVLLTIILPWQLYC